MMSTKQAEISAVSLIGMPGSGKSTLAPLLAEHLSYGCLDVDDWIRERTCRDIPYLVAEGQEFILSLQERCIREARMENLVISTPGSIIYTHYLDILREGSQIVYLKTPADVLQERIEAQANPQRVILSGDGGFEELYGQRDPLYSELADLTLEYQPESPDDSLARLLLLLGR